MCIDSHNLHTESVIPSTDDNANKTLIENDRQEHEQDHITE
jgi:hypothetical protein